MLTLRLLAALYDSLVTAETTIEFASSEKVINETIQSRFRPPFPPLDEGLLLLLTTGLLLILLVFVTFLLTGLLDRLRLLLGERPPRFLAGRGLLDRLLDLLMLIFLTGDLDRLKLLLGL